MHKIDEIDRKKLALNLAKKARNGKESGAKAGDLLARMGTHQFNPEGASEGPLKENDLIAEQVLVICEQEGIDPESLTEQELNELFNTLQEANRAERAVRDGEVSAKTAQRFKNKRAKGHFKPTKSARDQMDDTANYRFFRTGGGSRVKSGDKGPDSNRYGRAQARRNDARENKKKVPVIVPVRKDKRTPGKRTGPIEGRGMKAESTNNFIDRTVGILVDRLVELKIPTGGIPRNPATGRVRKGAAREVAANILAIARTGKVPNEPVKISPGNQVDLGDSKSRESWPQASKENRTTAGTITAKPRHRDRYNLTVPPRPKREDSSTNNFIDRTVEILWERSAQSKENKKKVKAWKAKQAADEAKNDSHPNVTDSDWNFNQAGESRRGGFKNSARYYLNRSRAFRLRGK